MFDVLRFLFPVLLLFFNARRLVFLFCFVVSADWATALAPAQAFPHPRRYIAWVLLYFFRVVGALLLTW